MSAQQYVVCTVYGDDGIISGPCRAYDSSSVVSSPRHAMAVAVVISSYGQIYMSGVVRARVGVKAWVKMWVTPGAGENIRIRVLLILTL